MNGAVEDDPNTLKFVPDWVVTRDWMWVWYDDYYDDGHWHDGWRDKLSEWYGGYEKRKAQKASIKEELMPIAWHPSRYWDWCMSEDEKQETEKLWR